MIVAPRVFERQRREQVKREARREVQQPVPCGIVVLDGVAAIGAKNGDAGATVIVNGIRTDDIARGIDRGCVDEDAPVVSRDLVVNDLVGRVPGTREQVDSSTHACRCLRAVVDEPVVVNHVAAAAVGDHDAVVPVVMGIVLSNVVVARGDEHDPLEGRHTERKWRAGPAIVVPDFVPLEH